MYQCTGADTGFKLGGVQEFLSTQKMCKKELKCGAP